MIRPERLRVANGNGGGVRATLQAAVFQGPVIRCLVQTPDGAEIVAHVHSDGPRPSLEPGSDFRLDWDFDAARLLPPAKYSRVLDADTRSTMDRAG